MRLKDKVVVIAGGTKGVGCMAAKAFASEGAKVVIGGRDDIAAMNVINHITDMGGKAVYVECDLLLVNQCEKLLKTAFEEFGRIDGFFHYAGITPACSLETCDEKTFDNVMDTNFKSAFFCCQQAIKYMKQNGGGSIVLTGSAHAWGGQKDRAAYACSKGVLLTLMEHISHNYSVDRIRCNYLTLGWTPTEGELNLRNSQGETEKELRDRASRIIPAGRMCEVNDYREVLIYLMSDESNMMTGSNLRITGGEYI